MWRDVKPASMHSLRHGKLRDKTASTGAIAIYIALRVCKQVSLFGFGSGSGEQRLPGCVEQGPPPCAKYYGHACIRMDHYMLRDTLPHNLILEHLWIQRLANHSKVTGYC